VVGRNLPGQAALFCNHRQMAIASRRWTRFPAGDHLDAIAMLRDHLVGGRTIIGTLSRHLANRIVNLIQQRRLLPGGFHGLRLTKRQKLRQQRSGSTVGQQGTNLRDDPLVFGRASVGHDLSDRVERPTTGHCAPTRSKSRRADLHRIKQRHQPPGALNFEGPLRTAALAASPAAAMTLRPPANKMALHGRKHPLSFRQRQPGPPWGVFATAASPLTS
jgi:hypothetical protein